MYLNYNGLDIDYNKKYITEAETIEFLKPIIQIADISRVNIWEITIEDDETTYIYLEKMGDFESWDQESIEFGRRLTDSNYEILFADEDYGKEFDVLIVYNKITDK